MSSKILVILAVLIIALSSFGLMATNTNKNQTQAKLQKIEVELLQTQKDIKKGEKITLENIKIIKKSVDPSYLKDSFIVDKKENFILGYTTNKDLSKGSDIRYLDVVAPIASQDDTLDVSVDGELAFSFPLAAREFSTIKSLKKGSSVDAYLRYETKTKNSDNGVVSKSLGSQSKENANLSKLILMFKDKRILNIKAKSSDPNSAGDITLQLKPDEIKSVYAIENLGHFYFFPSETDSKNGVSTKKILQSDFIKELRGGDK